jgi:hypothetical protein
MVAFVFACGKADSPKPIEAAQASVQTQAVAAKPAPVITGAPVGGLKVVEEPGVTNAVPTGYSWDFGDVDPVEKPRVEHKLMLINGGDKPVTIDKVDTSCSCTAAVVGEGKTLPLTLAPGEKAPLKVGLNVLSLHSGVVRKSVRVFGPGGATPEIAVEVRAKVLDAMSVEPRVIEVGKLTAANAQPLRVTAKVDSRWLEPGQSLQVMNMCPSLVVVPGAKETVTSGTPAKSMVLSQFDVKLSPDAPMGLVSGSIVFQVRIPAKLAGGAGVTLTKTVNAPVTGEIVGSVRALPAIVLMGTMEPGKGANQNVLLAGATSDAISKATAQSSVPFVTATVKEGAPEGSAEVRPNQYPITADGKRLLGAKGTLVISVKPEAPNGYFRATITCTLASGQKLVVPVEGYVKPKA